MAENLTNPRPTTDHYEEAKATILYARALLDRNIKWTPTDKLALWHLARMNHCECQLMTCATCKVEICDWLAAVIEKYVTLGRKNKTLTMYTRRAEMLHVSQLMAVMVALCERHIVATRRDVPNARSEAEFQVSKGLFLEIDWLVYTVPYPPVSYAALLTMACFSYESLTNVFLLPFDLAECIRWMTRHIDEEPIALLPLDISANRFHFLLELLILMIGQALFRVPVALAVEVQFEAVLDVVSGGHIGVIGAKIFFQGPKDLKRKHLPVNIQQYGARAKAYLDGVETLLKTIRNFEEAFRGMPCLRDHPRWPCRQIGLIWELIERLPDDLKSFDPYCLRE